MDRSHDPLPNPLAVRVALGQQFIGALSRDGVGIGTIPLRQQIGCAPRAASSADPDRRKLQDDPEVALITAGAGAVEVLKTPAPIEGDAASGR